MSSRHILGSEAEAINWFGEPPSHWSTIRMAALFTEVDRPADPNLPVLSVSIHTGVTDRELGNDERDRNTNLSEDRTKYQRVKAGDLVYNMMRAWQGAFGTVTVDGLVSPAYVVAEPKANFRTKFVELLLQTACGTEEVRRFSKGIADFRMRLYWDHFRNLKVCLPPLAEQDTIIRHVEAESARIDGLIGKKRRFIGLLEEKRSAVIIQVVTRPSDSDWVETPLKYVVSCNDDVISEHSDDERISYVDISAVQYGKGITGAQDIRFADAPSRARRKARAGDVIVSTVRTYLKAIAPVEERHAECVFSTGFAVLRPKADRTAPAYLKWLLIDEMLVQKIEAHSEGLSYPTINASELIALKVHLPPYHQQVRLAEFLEQETSRIDQLIAKTERSIELLKEHRSALINAAVTGKFDVRNAA